MARRLAAVWTRALDVVGAAATAVLAFLAVPAVLVLVVGNPLSGGLGHAWHPASRDALCVLVAAAWVAWVACCAQLGRAVVVRVRRGEVGIRAGASVMDRVAARIALGVLAVTTLGAPAVLSPGAGASAPTHTHVGAPTAAAGTSATPRAGAPAAVARVYLAQPGDSLWSIADAHGGDGADWTAIAALNLGRDMGDGTHFVDPDQLRPGWRLGLPPAGDDRTALAAPGDRRPSGRPLPAHLPELVALGVGSLACAALARRTRRRRELCRLADLPGLPDSLSEGAIDAAALLNRFERVPALDSFEAANCLLGRVLHERAASGQGVRAVCVGPAGVTFLLVTPDPDAPPGFTPTLGGTAWHVDHGGLCDPEPFRPHLPIALPVGDDDEGTWLVPLGPGAVLPLLGAAGPALWRAARSVQESWSWADHVLVTDDPDEVPRALPRPGAADPFTARPVLFFGDPAHLAPEVAGRTAVVTTAAVAASDVTVLVDRHGASIHPVGRLVRPHMLTDAVGAQLEELVRGPEHPTGHRDTARCSPSPHDERLTPREGARSSALFPGTIDVRLLTATPRLEGLRGELPANRARRAVELVAYLALHQPDAVTGDRLRTRVLGSSDTDAAAKTLFNTAYAARRAMGVDAEGDPLFPGASRAGLYHVSPQVTVDVHRAVALADKGRACTDSSLAMAHFRTALELVEGEPLANALAGYSWWEAEGHGGRVASVLVDAACRLAALAVDAGLYDLARLGLEKARHVEPYSEALSRAAMEVAAAEGDADRLRREWLECQRRVDALDPGSSPSPRTESLYGELAHRVSVEHRPGHAERYVPAASD